MGNFPRYKILGEAFVVFFTSAERRTETEEWKHLIENAKKEEPGILFAWMDMYGFVFFLYQSYVGTFFNHLILLQNGHT